MQNFGGKKERPLSINGTANSLYANGGGVLRDENEQINGNQIHHILCNIKPALKSFNRLRIIGVSTLEEWGAREKRVLHECLSLESPGVDW